MAVLQREVRGNRFSSNRTAPNRSSGENRIRPQNYLVAPESLMARPRRRFGSGCRRGWLPSIVTDGGSVVVATMEAGRGQESAGDRDGGGR